MAERAQIDVIIEGAGAATTLGQLEESAEALNEALRGAEIGSEEYKKLNDALVDTNRQVKNLELGFEALDNEQVASEIGSVAGAIGDVTSSLILLGGENESLEKMAANIQTALGVSMAFKGAIEGISSAQKLWTNIVKRYTIVQTVANVVTKAFNTILRLNPIGLIVTAVGLLIGGLVLLAKNVQAVGDWFVELGGWVKSTIDGFGKWKYVILALLGPIGWLIAAWDYFFGEQAKHSAEELARLEREKKAREEANKQNVEDHKRRLNEIAERRKAEEEAFKSKQTEFDLEIERMEAEGKNAQALRIAKQEAVIQEVKDQIQAIRDIEASWTEYYERQAELQGKSREEYIEILKNQGIDVVALQEELNGEIEKLDQQLFSAESGLIKLKLQGRKEVAEEEVKVESEKVDNIIAENQRLADELFKQRLTVLERLEDANKDEFQLKMEALQEQYLAEQELFKGNQEVLLQLEQEYEENLAEIRRQAEEADTELVRQQAEEKANARIEAIDKFEQRAMTVLGAVENIQTIFHGKELKRIKEKRDSGEALTKNEIKRLKREDQIRKAQALAQIVADTARGISGAVAAGAGVPFPANLLAIGSGIASVLSGIAQASQVLGESPDLGSAGGGLGGGTGGGTDTGGTDRVPDLDPLGFGSTLLNQPNKVYVTETDITNVQGKVSVIEQQASFG